MNMDILILCDTKADNDLLHELQHIAKDSYFQIYDFNNRNARSKLRKILYEYASNILPFILVKDKKSKRGFYSETGDNAINQLINFLKNGNKI